MMRPVIMSALLVAATVPRLCDAADAMTTVAAGQASSDRAESDHIKVFTINYTIPPVQLVRDDGKTVSLPEELDDGRAVVLNFVYTTCETTCPLSSATFSQFQANLGADRKGVHLVSISIDPEQDTPARLREYAKKFGAGPGWQYYTGTQLASITAQQAFGAYRGDKMSHMPVTFMRAAPGKAWMRIDGFVTPDQLLHHYRDMITAR